MALLSCPEPTCAYPLEGGELECPRCGLDLRPYLGERSGAPAASDGKAEASLPQAVARGETDTDPSATVERVVLQENAIGSRPTPPVSYTHLTLPTN